jgi:3-hydroxyisobutyrate dehydrogenase
MKETISPVIGVAGLGRMGSAMAARLMDCGFSVIVWNRSAGKTEAIERIGAMVAPTLHSLVAHASTIITVLRDDAAAREVYLASAGLCSSAVSGKLFIDMSTLKPSTLRELHARVRAAGAAMIEAPVSGTVTPARAGKLVALVGGDAADLKRARPVLEALTRRIIHAGPAGQGALLKLVVNLPLAVYWHSLGEALALGETGGLDRRLIVETIADSSAALAVLGLKIPSIMGQSDDVAFDVASMRKDLLAIIETSAGLGTTMTSASAALGAYSAAIAVGLGAEDAVAVTRSTVNGPPSRPNAEQKG